MHILVSVHTNIAIQQIVSQILQRFQMSMTIKGILRHNLRLLCQVWLASPLFSCRLMSACLWEMWFHIDQLVICQITLTVLFILQIKILQNHAGSQGLSALSLFCRATFLVHNILLRRDRGAAVHVIIVQLVLCNVFTAGALH